MRFTRWGAAIAVAATVAAGAGAAAEPQAPQPPKAGATGEPAIGVVLQRGLGANESALMRAGGIGSVRTWFAWHAVERVRDHYDWGGLDHAVRAVSSSGLTVLPFLFGSPEWAAERDGYECRDFDCIPYAPASIETRYAFARFAGAAVERYGPGGTFWENNPELPYRPIGAWQIWNEQNSQSFYMPDADPLAYAEVVELAAAEIRAVDADAEVVLGGMFGPRSSSRLDAAARYLDEFYTAPKIENSFDGIALHPYSPKINGVLGQIRAAIRVVRNEVDNPALWITEIGWASSGERDERLVKSPKGQARLLRESFSLLADSAARWRLRGIYWYAWRDTRAAAAVCVWCPGAGLITRGGTPKPAYRTLRRLANGR